MCKASSNANFFQVCFRLAAVDGFVNFKRGRTIETFPVGLFALVAIDPEVVPGTDVPMDPDGFVVVKIAFSDMPNFGVVFIDVN